MELNDIYKVPRTAHIFGTQTVTKKLILVMTCDFTPQVACVSEPGTLKTFKKEMLTPAAVNRREALHLGVDGATLKSHCKASS